MTFRRKMEESEKRSCSRIVLALDQVPKGSGNLLSKSIEILERTQPYICALKLNRHIVLPLGLFDGVPQIIERAQGLNLPVIMDCKINDVGYTNRAIAENYFKAGFDAITANPFVGWEEGLQPVFEVSHKMGRGVILLVYMSHKAAWEGYKQKVWNPEMNRSDPQYIVFAGKALSWKADGAVVGATYPDKIREVYEILKDDTPIYSPGIGAQGGDAKTAFVAGSRYLIVGRAITLADKPELTAQTLMETARRDT